MKAAFSWDEKNATIFHLIDRTIRLSGRQLHRTDLFRMVKRMALPHGSSDPTCNHTFCAITITTYRRTDDQIEIAHTLAAPNRPAQQTATIGVVISFNSTRPSE